MRTLPDKAVSISGLATLTCHGIGARSHETDDATIDMKPRLESASQEVLAGLVECVTYHNAENGFRRPKASWCVKCSIGFRRARAGTPPMRARSDVRSRWSGGS